MKEQFSDHQFLAKWLNEDLTVQEKEVFEKSEDFDTYNRIVNAVDRLQPLPFDKKKTLQEINQTIDQQPKVINIIPKWMYGAAASLLILIGLTYFTQATATYQTTYGAHQSVFLPDGSEIIINANSEITHKKYNWSDQREVFLNGEAFFKVKKGSKFTVNTPSGTVEVLGTQFNVQAQKDFFEVLCTEGKVKVTSNQQAKSILTKGNAVRFMNTSIEKWNEDLQDPTWISGETSFTNTPLRNVLTALENRFNLNFVKENIDLEKRFTGSFNHQNMDIALKTIFVPMEISYTFKKENMIILVKE